VKLIDLFESRFQEQAHHNPSVATLKALARNNRYHSARFVITRDGDVVAGDSEHHTHHSMAPFMGAWVVRGYVQYMGDGEYAYRSMEVYSALNKDHPILRTWERMGIENGNTDQSNLSEAPDQDRLEHMMGMDPHTFDQTPQGWRSLVRSGQMEHAIHALLSYIQKYVKNGKYVSAPQGTKRLDPSVLSWHLGQLFAMQHNYNEAIRWMKRSFNPEDSQWNDYVMATMAFLKGDQAELSRLAAKDNYNKETIDRLASGVGKPYSQVYEQTQMAHMQEAWSDKYKRSINCNHPRGFSQRAHCAARKRRQGHKPTRSKPV
jgi:hypothetical protein